jgi:hypothetical protein
LGKVCSRSTRSLRSALIWSASCFILLKAYHAYLTAS